MQILKKILFLFLFLPIILFAQSNNKRIKIIQISEYEFNVDSFSIINNTFHIFTNDTVKIHPDSYLINEIDARLKITDSTLFGSSIIMEYEVYPVLLSKSYYNKKPNDIQGDKNTKTYWSRNKNQPKNQKNSTLHKLGNISRNIISGNTQDLSILSNIDLRITGKLSENLQIQAVISDNNLPFQEDGSSYKLQEFDKVFIRVFNKENEFISGDIFTQNYTRFLNYKRKSKGIIYTSKRKRDKYNFKSSTSISMSKGKFHINNFNGTEGNQGPYNLKGMNGENYIVVLSGTEKVYIDGNRLKRGLEFDYIIDYNTSEIIFTHKNIITKDKRIFVEFEYNDRSYGQSVITSSQTISNNKSQFSVDIYSEKDWKNTNYLTQLTDSDKLNLSASGDTENDIFSSSIDSVSYNSEKILYKKLEVLLNGTEIVYYKYSVNSDSAHYQIKFTEIGENNGNYILKEEGINGKIYEFINPLVIANQLLPQGNYTPNVRIIAPKSKTVISTEITHQINKKIQLISNFTFQQEDKNLFSELDDNDNQSIATITSIYYTIFNNDKWKISSLNYLEYIQKNYSGINRYKEVEFNRNWDINNTIGNQTLINSQLKIEKKNSGFIQFNFQNLKIGSEYSAMKNYLLLKHESEKEETNISGNLSFVKTNEFNSILLFYKSNTQRKFKYFNVNIDFNIENISQIDYYENLINANGFTEYKTQISNEIVSVNYENRYDNKQAKNFSEAQQLSFDLKLDKNKILKYNTHIILRKLNYIPDSITDEHNILSSNNIQLNLWNNFININSKYELGKGKEAKKEQTFIKVPNGMGTHNWIDENNNGFQELNEFVIALFQDEAEYVNLILPSSHLENIYNINYHNNIRIDVKQITKNSFLRKFYFQNNMQIQNKNTEFIPNPFHKKSTDSSVTYLYQNINSVSYNRLNKKINIQFSIKDNQIQNSYYYATDQLKIHEKRWIINNKIKGNFKHSIVFVSGNKENISDYFTSKNYQYNYIEIADNITFENKENRKFDFYYKRKIKEINSISSKMKSNEIGVLFQKENEKNRSFKSDIKYVNIKFDGSENSLLNYELMEGLSVGSNFVWTLNYRQILKNNLQINMQYSGRTSETSKVKHIGNLGVTAYF